MQSVELFSSPDQWCLPVLIAAVLIVLNVLRPLLGSSDDTRRKVRESLVHLAWGLILFIILQYLCQSGMVGMAWIVLFIPVIIGIIGMVAIAYGFSMACEKHPELCKRLMH